MNRQQVQGIVLIAVGVVGLVSVAVFAVRVAPQTIAPGPCFVVHSEPAQTVPVPTPAAVP